MPWFGLSSSADDDDLDEFLYGGENDEDVVKDLETGGTLPSLDDALVVESLLDDPLNSVPGANPSSSGSSSSSSDEAAVARRDATLEAESLANRVTFRTLKQEDRARIQQLHEDWFPVTYSDEFYEELTKNHKLATSGDDLFTCVATVAEDEHQDLICQATGGGAASAPAPQPSSTKDTIIGCVVGAFIHPSRLNPETADLLVPHPEVHSRLFYIMTLGTVEEYRNYGVATSLVQQCMDLVKIDPTCGALYLHVIPFNHAAIRFYEKLGFYRVVTIENYYNIDDKHYDCYLYAKYFNGNPGHRTLYKLVSGAISTLWQHLKAPLSLFYSSSQPSRF